MERHIVNTLKELGIPANLDGYNYLKTAIKLRLETSEEKMHTTSMYLDVAKVHATASTRVERGIRHAIEVGITRGSVDTWQKLFRYSYCSNRGKPTNSEFIATLVEYVRIFCNDKEEKDVSNTDARDS